MTAEALPVWTAVAAILATLGARQVIVWFFINRGKIKVDEATAIRVELRGEIQTKKQEIADLKKEMGQLAHRMTKVEDERDKIEQEFNQQTLAFRMYRLDVYRTLVEHGADRAVLDSVRLLDM